MKHYRSTVDETKTISVDDSKAERFDASASWEPYDPDTGTDTDLSTWLERDDD